MILCDRHACSLAMNCEFIIYRYYIMNLMGKKEGGSFLYNMELEIAMTPCNSRSIWTVLCKWEEGGGGGVEAGICYIISIISDWKCVKYEYVFMNEFYRIPISYITCLKYTVIGELQLNMSGRIHVPIMFLKCENANLKIHFFTFHWTEQDSYFRMRVCLQM